MRLDLRIDAQAFAALGPLRFLPPAFRAESLSRKALAILTNTKGVTCVLSGMRRRNYVDDSLGALRSPADGNDGHARKYSS